MKSPLLRTGLAIAALMFASAVLAVVMRPTHKIADQAAKFTLVEMIPVVFGDWKEDKTIVPVQPPPDLQAVLDKTYDQTLSKTYVNASGERIMLSVAYGGNQHEGMNTHRPEICYPAQGFQLVSSRPDTLQVFGKDLPINRVVAIQGRRNEPITYWLVVGNELTHFGLGHKLTTLKYGLTGRIPDGMLIRVSSIDPDEIHAFYIQDLFIREMLKAMKLTDRNRLLGSL